MYRCIIMINVSVLYRMLNHFCVGTFSSDYGGKKARVMVGLL